MDKEYETYAKLSKENILELCSSEDPICEDDRFWQLVSQFHLSPGLDFEPGFYSYEELVYFLWSNPERALEKAVSNDNRAVLDYILSQNFTENLNKALIYAAGSGQRDLIEYLIISGADDLDGALLAATEEGRIEIVKYLISLGASNLDEALIIAVQATDIELIKFFISLGANNLNQALLVAVQTGDIELVEFFIKHGAKNLHEALILARRYSLEDIVEYLLAI